MDTRLASLEAHVSRLTADLAETRARLARLEDLTTPREPVILVPPMPEIEAGAVQGWLSLAGRTLLVLGGAYLLRALTAAHVLPVAAGVFAGLLYGAPWLLLASRAGARGRTLDAFCHGLATALIGYPLVWEATVSFAVFTPSESAIVLGALTAAALTLSAMQRLHSLAGIVTAGALMSAVSLGIATQSWTGYTMLAIGTGLATLWLGYVCDWVFYRWPAALVADLLVVVLTGHPDSVTAWVVVAQLLTLVGYLGSFAVRTLFLSRSIIPFEAVQTVGVLVCALGSLFSFAHGNAAGMMFAAGTTVLLGAASYGLAFVWSNDRSSAKNPANLLYYSSLGLLLLIIGVAQAGAEVSGPTYGLLGVAAAILARARLPRVLWIHAATFAFAAAFVCGLPRVAAGALTVAPALWQPLDAGCWFALACLAVMCATPLADGTARFIDRLPRFTIEVLLGWSAIGAGVLLASLLLPGAAADAAWLATLRSALLVAAAILTARLGRSAGWPEAGWLTYPILIIAGAKLLVSDVPQGRPITMFVALALYGTALIVAPRALRRALPPAPPSPDSSGDRHDPLAVGP
jgi:hypothetical protein